MCVLWSATGDCARDILCEAKNPAPPYIPPKKEVFTNLTNDAVVL